MSSRIDFKAHDRATAMPTAWGLNLSTQELPKIYAENQDRGFLKLRSLDRNHPCPRKIKMKKLVTYLFSFTIFSILNGLIAVREARN